MQKSRTDEQDVDVAELMHSIREKVVRRSRQRGSPAPAGQKDDSEFGLISEIQKDMDYVLSNWDIQNQGYVISSHRKVIGGALVKGRKVVHGEVRRYVDPAISRQRDFNSSVARLLDHALRESDNAARRLAEMEEAQLELKEDLMKAVSERISQARLEIGEEMEKRQREHEERLRSEGTGKKWGDFYSKEVSEDDLKMNIAHHQDFISLVKEFASRAAGQRIPRLLEVGFGTATMSIYLSRYPYEVVGIDSDPHVVYRAMHTNRRLGGYAKFVLMDALDLDMFREGYFDVAFSQGTMEHFDDQKIAQLLARQLKVARYVIFSVPSVNWDTRDFGNERRMTVEDWKKILQNGGFEPIKIDYYQNDWHIACAVGSPPPDATGPGSQKDASRVTGE